MRLRAVSHSEGGERGAEGDFSVRYPLFALRIPSRRLGGNALLVWMAHPLLRSCISRRWATNATEAIVT